MSTIINYLIAQSKSPSGLGGRILTKIWSTYFQKLSLWTLNLTTIPQSARILDIGFGGGINIQNLASMTEKSTIHGIDISREAYKQASKVNRQLIQKGQVHLSLADVTRLPFPDQCFDLIVATQTHIYWDELAKGLAECARVLRKEGKLLISSEKDKINYHLPAYSDPNDFVALLNQQGFTKITIKDTPSYIGFICQKKQS
ncbi:class I SAM-dependent methyltransferase [Streptococcus tangpeifui]|uniref:class I SAM-dependent methyltransferase n=1 Tax=Streptococcus tangpeifui TaxID=2709400 RepID=UPI0013EA01CE|nr:MULTISPECIES: class I SAM-dependent methyltransferase [unclassified Streptococcus]